MGYSPGGMSPLLPLLLLAILVGHSRCYTHLYNGNGSVLEWSDFGTIHTDSERYIRIDFLGKEGELYSFDLEPYGPRNQISVTFGVSNGMKYQQFDSFDSFALRIRRFNSQLTAWLNGRRIAHEIGWKKVTSLVIQGSANIYGVTLYGQNYKTPFATVFDKNLGQNQVIKAWFTLPPKVTWFEEPTNRFSVDFWSTTRADLGLDVFVRKHFLEVKRHSDGSRFGSANIDTNDIFEFQFELKDKLFHFAVGPVNGTQYQSGDGKVRDIEAYMMEISGEIVLHQIELTNGSTVTPLLQWEPKKKPERLGRRTTRKPATVADDGIDRGCGQVEGRDE